MGYLQPFASAKGFYFGGLYDQYDQNDQKGSRRGRYAVNCKWIKTREGG